MAVDPGRRAVLAAGAAAVPLLVSACRGVQVLGTPPPPAPDILQLRAAMTAELLMISRYHAAITGAAGNPAAASELTRLLAEHEQHLAMLRSRLIEPHGSATAAAAPSAGAALPPDLSGALTALAASEQAAADRLASQLLAVPPSLAQLLASISASESTHVPVLDQLRRMT